MSVADPKTEMWEAARRIRAVRPDMTTSETRMMAVSMVTAIQVVRAAPWLPIEDLLRKATDAVVEDIREAQKKLAEMERAHD